MSFPELATNVQRHVALRTGRTCNLEYLTPTIHEWPIRAYIAIKMYIIVFLNTENIDNLNIQSKLFNTSDSSH